MSCRLSVVCFFAVASGSAAWAHAFSHISESSFLSRDDIMDVAVDKPHEDKTVDPLKPIKKLGDKTKELGKTVGKSLESRINIMRGELCWQKQKIIEHDSCMEWLVEECATGHSFGTGLCEKVRNKVKEECDKKHEKACGYAKQLGIDVTTITTTTTAEATTTTTTTTAEATTAEPTTAEPTAAPTAEPATPAPTKAPEPEEAAPSPVKEEPKKTDATKTAKPGGYEAPDAKDGLKSQGYKGKKVTHEDGETQVSDWGNEYGHHPEPEPKPKKSSSQRSSNIHAFMGVAFVVIALSGSA